MKNRKFLACVLVSAMVCGIFASCGENKDTEPSATEKQTESVTEAVQETATEETSEETTEEVTEETTQETELEAEEKVKAHSGDAYLYFNEKENDVYYDGTENGVLTYGAGVQHVDGNGTYTVSVTVDTNGFKLSGLGGESTNELNTMAVVIKDGKTLHPNAVITIDSVSVNGTETELSGKNYTYSPDGTDIRSDIFTKESKETPEDALDENGQLVSELESPDEYSDLLIDSSKFSDWTQVEVTFTVSGIGDDESDALEESQDDSDEVNLDEEALQEDDEITEDESETLTETSTESDEPVYNEDGEQEL